MANKGSSYQTSNLTANLAGSVYVALYLNDPGTTDIGDEAKSYTRQPVQFGLPVPDGSAASAPSDSDVVFPGKSGGYGTITHVALKDAATGGKLIYYAALSEPIRSKDNEPIKFPAGSLKASEE